MVSRTYAWLATTGGAWSLPSNWNDITDGADPSLTVPGPLDTVVVAGPGGSTVQTLTGQGDVLAAAFSGNSALSGSFTIGTLTMGAGGGGGLLDVGPASSVGVATLSVGSGSLIANGQGGVVSAAQATLGAGQSGAGAASCNLDATGGGRVQLGGLTLNASSATLYVDTASSIEVGIVGGAAPGALSVDAGATLSGQGDADGYGRVVNNGTIAAEGGTLLLGAVSGNGLLSIGANAVLTLNGATGAGQSLAFAAASATLALATEFDAPQGTISGFATGDAIDVLGSTISSASYTATGANAGILNLFYGNQLADRLLLAGNYTNDVFLTAPDGDGGTLITEAPGTSGGGTPSPGTSTPDQYLWLGQGGGSWNSAANWQDQTSGSNPARIAPGLHDLVTIDAPRSGGFAVIAGPANAATLTATGDLALSGTFSIGTLTVGQGGDAAGANQVAGTLDLLQATRIAASTVAVADGAIGVADGAVLAVSGTLTLGGGAAGVGLPVTALSATAGGTITAAAIMLGGGSGDTITTDPTGVIEIGGAGGAVAGAVTVDAGASLAGNGAVNPYGAVVDNGTITASGGLLTLGHVTGAGVLTIGAGAGLILNAGTAIAIDFTGAGAALAVADELVAVTGAISGFVPGDTIDILNDPITGLGAHASEGNTDITLYYGSNAVCQFVLAGSFAGEHFVLSPDGNNGTNVQVAAGSGGGGNPGQGSTDLMAWAQPGSGAWNRTGNWTDVTTGNAALAPPGSENAVDLIGAQGSFQEVGGPGVCAALNCFGDTLLYGAFTAAALAVGGSLNGTATTAILDIGASAGATAATAVADGGVILVEGRASTFSVAGTLMLGGSNDGSLAASGDGVVTLGGLMLGGQGASGVSADLLSSVEIGTLGGAALGAVTIDAGFAVTGYGAVNTGGSVIDDGTLTAQGGTLAVGACSGTGMLDIGTEATLQITGATAAEIVFTGKGATLLLPGSAEDPSGVIAGFAAGDAIVTGASSIAAAVYTPGAGNVGTLTLYSGTAKAGALLLAGNFAGDTFTVRPDGDGSAIDVQAAVSGPPAGTTTPDNYVWTGLAGTLWGDAANWSDVTAGQQIAVVAPGAQDLVTIQGAAGNGFSTIIGPADAAALAILGNVALAGQYGVGTLSIAATSELALGAGASMAAAAASVSGLVAVQTGGLAIADTLLLQGGLLQATASAAVQAGTLVLAGAGSVLMTDGTGRIEVGTAGDAVAGAIIIDAGAVLQGEGAVAPQGMVIDDGTVIASTEGQAAGTLAVGAITGVGTLVIGVDASLALLGSAGGGLLIDFAGPGTLTVAAALPLAVIAGFAVGDAIAVPESGVTDVEYAATGAGLGVLTLFDGGTQLGQLTLSGVGAGQSFTAVQSGDETILTTQTTTYGGGNTMNGSGPTSGSGTTALVSSFAWWAGLAGVAQDALTTFQEDANGNSYVWTSPTGTGFGAYEDAYANIAVAGPQELTSLGSIGLPSGYNALVALGGTAVLLTDGSGDHALIVGNSGHDTIVGFGDGDTLVGGSGNSVIWCADGGSIGTVVYGGGSDTIVTSAANARVTTSANNRSVIFLGAASNSVTLQGNDSVACGSGNGANDTITAAGSDVVFAPGTGVLTHIDGAGRDLVVGEGGTVRLIGGTGNGGVLWCGSAVFAQYLGGAGTELIVGGSGELSVQGGAGVITVFGGSGAQHIQGAPGRSQFILGSGDATVSAASGNDVWLAGAANDSLVATTGNIVLWAAGSTGENVFQAGSGPCTIHGGLGADTFLGGAGSTTITGGGGADAYSFTNGLAGGAVQVTDFNAALDQIQLHGYGAYTDSIVGGNLVIGLSDGSSIQLDGITALAGVSISGG